MKHPNVPNHCYFEAFWGIKAIPCDYNMYHYHTLYLLSEFKQAVMSSGCDEHYGFGIPT